MHFSPHFSNTNPHKNLSLWLNQETQNTTTGAISRTFPPETAFQHLVTATTVFNVTDTDHYVP
jgi:hypothetical protein